MWILKSTGENVYTDISENISQTYGYQRRAGLLNATYNTLDSTNILAGTTRWVYQGHRRTSYRTDLFWTQKNFTGQHFWARGYYVSTVGRDEKAIREYIKAQEAEDLRLDQLDLFR